MSAVWADGSPRSQGNAFGQFGGGPGVGLIGNLFGIRAAIAVAALLHTPILWLYGRFVKQNDAVVLLDVNPQPEVI